MGQILIEMEKAGEIAKHGGSPGNQYTIGKVAPHDLCSQKTIADLEITKDQSSRYKALANAPDDGGSVSRPPCNAFTPRARGT